MEFKCTVHKVQNMSNGGYRVALDIPTIYFREVAELLMIADTPGIVLNIKAEPENTNLSINSEERRGSLG